MSASDLPIGESLDVHAITDTVFDTVGAPVRSAALFYALYYLVEVEGVAELGFEFKQVRERQVRGFYWYGLVSVVNELSHLHDRYFIDGESANLDMAEPEPVVREHIFEELLPEGKPAAGDNTLTMAEWAVDAFRVFPELWEVEDPGQFRAALDDLQRNFSAVTDPVPFLENCQRLMEATGTAPSPPGADARTIREEGLTGWARGYNGPAWEGIVEHLLRRGDISDTAWVDTSWSIEHNNRRWIDKIDMMVGDAQNRAVVRVLDLERFDDPVAQNVRPSDVDDAVNDVLDAARDGPTSRLFEWASHFDGHRGVSFSRWQRRLNIR